MSSGFVLKGLSRAVDPNGHSQWRDLAVGDKSVILPAIDFHQNWYLLSLAHDDTDQHGRYKIIRELGPGTQDIPRMKAFLNN